MFVLDQMVSACALSVRHRRKTQYFKQLVTFVFVSCYKPPAAEAACHPAYCSLEIMYCRLSLKRDVVMHALCLICPRVASPNLLLAARL